MHLIEDGLGEDDEDGWIALTARLGGSRWSSSATTIFCTNPAIITRAIERRASPTPSLIKLNQIGTVTETLEAMAVCRAGRATGSSSRTAPGRPRTIFIADLAVGTGCGQLKTGAPATRRARRQVQPAHRDRRQQPRPPLRHRLITVRGQGRGEAGIQRHDRVSPVTSKILVTIPEGTATRKVTWRATAARIGEDNPGQPGRVAEVRGHHVHDHGFYAWAEGGQQLLLHFLRPLL